MKKISVIIVTKDRAKELIHNLGCLATQSLTLDELIVIDNNSSDNTREVVANFKKNSKFSVSYHKELKIGYPIVYNTGLRKAKHNFVAFIDDDCVATKDWFLSIKSFLEKFNKADVVMGESDTYYKENIFSFLTFFFDKFWKENQISGKKIIDFEVLDNKNIVYNKNFLIKNNLKFNEKIVPIFNGACEDSELGMQIQKAGGNAFYNSKMKISHKDPDSFIWYYKKLFFTTRSHLLYEERWNSFRRKKSIGNKKIKALPFALRLLLENNKGFIFSLFFFFHLFLTIFITKLVRLFSFFKNRE